MISLDSQEAEVVHWGAGEGTASLFSLVSTQTSFSEQPGRIAIPGLDPDREFRAEAIIPTQGNTDYSHTFCQVHARPGWQTAQWRTGGS